MVRASEDWIYIYGPGDERLWTIHAPTPQGSTWTATFTLRGLGAEMLREYELVGGTVSGTWSETDTGYRDGRVLTVVSPTETQHASLDPLGMPRLWTGPGGVVRKQPEHLPYGEPAISSDQKLQFTGHERDERGASTTDVGGVSSGGVRRRRGGPVSIRIVRLGSDRLEGEGLRIGTVRRPPRGVPKEEHAARNFYDIWYPELAPSAELVKEALGATTDADWRAFVRKYRSEMNQPAARRTLDLLAALSHQTDFSVGCYCEDEARCHRSVLRELLVERGAEMGDAHGSAAS